MTACRNWTKPPRLGHAFAALPPELARAKNYAEWAKSLKNYLYRERTLPVYRCSELKQWSRAAESEREFRLRLVQASREERDQQVEALRASMRPSSQPLRSRSAAPGNGWRKNRPRQADQPGMRPSLWAIRCWALCLAARPSVRPT